MEYMRDQRDARARTTHLLTEARTAVVCLANYGGHSDVVGDMRVARYAQGDDYHDRIADGLDELASFIRAELGSDVATRSATDMLPLLERELAERAGLGWVGKNSMLIDQKFGSFTLIGTVLVAADIAVDVEPHADRCGTCRSCIDVCPTNAIVSPGIIDARRCISYLTIEHRGPIPRNLRPLLGAHLFGCDLCQNVCPWNVSRSDSEVNLGLSRRSLFDDLDAEGVLRLTRDEYAEMFRGSAMKRARYDGLLRNAAVVLGNSGNPAASEPIVEQLWESPEELVRGHCAWALSRIGWDGAESALRNRSVIERSNYVQEEIRWALSQLRRPC